MSQSRRSFLKHSGATAFGFFCAKFIFASKAIAQVAASTQVWRNWSRNVTYKPDHFFTPASVEEVTQIVLNSKSLRAVGASHSFNKIVPGKSLVSAENFKDIAIDSAKMEVEVGAGVTLKELIEKLVEAGFAFHSTGEINEQTIAGLISTATKGTGIKFGSISDPENLLGISLVTADGRHLQIDFSDPQFRDVAPALRLSLGSFGFVTSVRLKIWPSFQLTEQSIKTSLEEALLPKYYLDNYRYSFYYYPHANQTIQRIQNKTTGAYSEEALKIRNEKKLLMEDTLGNLVLDALSHVRSEIPKVSNTFFSTLKDDSATGRWDEIMILPRKTRYTEMQYTVPVEKLPAALDACLEKSRSFAEQDIYYVDMPLYIRFSRGDDGTFLSPAKGKNKIYAQIDFNCHHAQKNSDKFLQAIEQDLLKLGGIPHWGKIFNVQAGRLHPDAQKFEMLRRRWDPENKFQNDFIKDQISSLF